MWGEMWSVLATMVLPLPALLLFTMSDDLWKRLQRDPETYSNAVVVQNAEFHNICYLIFVYPLRFQKYLPLLLLLYCHAWRNIPEYLSTFTVQTMEWVYSEVFRNDLRKFANAHTIATCCSTNCIGTAFPPFSSLSWLTKGPAPASKPRQ